MTDPFFKALFAMPPRVLGRQLHPFSLSHSYLLDQLGNGWGLYGDGTRQELFAAVWICGQTHAENQRTLFGDALPLRRLAWWAWRQRRADFPAEEAAFRQYMSDYLTLADKWEKVGAVLKGFRAPWQFHYVRRLCIDYGCKLDEAWDMPCGLARDYYDVWAEDQGDDSLLTARERELAEQARKGAA